MYILNYILIITPVLHVLDFVPQVCRGANGDCSKAVAKSVAYVPSCPTTIKERDRAANIKNCSKLATQQNCSNVLDYHCVINGFGNETLEVCATKRLIDGDVYALIYILYSKSFFVSLYKIVLVLFNELLIIFFRILHRI